MVIELMVDLLVLNKSGVILIHKMEVVIVVGCYVLNSMKLAVEWIILIFAPLMKYIHSGDGYYGGSNMADANMNMFKLSAKILPIALGSSAMLIGIMNNHSPWKGIWQCRNWW